MQVFVELNELMVDKNQEMQWKETARWIKFEEDVEEETDRWGKPHVASLSFRSLLELRRTLSHGRPAWQGGGRQASIAREQRGLPRCQGRLANQLFPPPLQGLFFSTWTRRPSRGLPIRSWSR